MRELKGKFVMHLLKVFIAVAGVMATGTGEAFSSPNHGKHSEDFALGEAMDSLLGQPTVSYGTLNGNHNDVNYDAFDPKSGEPTVKVFVHSPNPFCGSEHRCP